MKNYHPIAVVLALCAGATWASSQCETLKFDGPAADPGSFHRFGYSVSLSDNRMVVSEYGGLDLDGAEIFERSPSGAWISSGAISASDGEVYDDFGYAVAIDADTAVIGAVADGDLGAKGAAYVFERQPDGVWTETQKFVPPHPDAWGYGWGVDIDGDRFVVGAKGASSLGGGKGWVFVYEREGSAWVHKASIQPSSSSGGDGFGESVDLEGERLAIGSSYDWTIGKGAAFVFERDASGTSWTEMAEFSPAELVDGDIFGKDVALHGDRVVVGSPLHSLPAIRVGAAYVFDNIGGTWQQTAKLTPDGWPYLTYFGWAVDVEEETVIVGARSGHGQVMSSGVAYRFEEGPGSWDQTKFEGTGLVLGDTFGWSVDLDGSSVLVGAPHTVSGVGTPGYAYLFDLEPSGVSLLAHAEEVSLSEGGEQILQLGGCVDHAGDLYFVAGSSTGASPGFFYAGQAVPLNPDPYFLHTINKVGMPPLTDAFGTLNFNGFGEAAFALPPGSEPALAGLVLNHAYAVLDGATLQLEAVSQAVPVTLVP